MSAVVILFGLFMIGAIFTGVGPSPRVGVVFGGFLVAFGVLRLYWILKR